MIVFADAEALTKAWLLTTRMATLLTRTDGGVSIFGAMPTTAPIPALVLRRVGGAPVRASDLPYEDVRVQFDCWGKTRPQAVELARSLMVELESLARFGGFDLGDARLAAAEVRSMLWLPDPDSDTPRYIVDATVTTLHA